MNHSWEQRFRWSWRLLAVISLGLVLTLVWSPDVTHRTGAILVCTILGTGALLLSWNSRFTRVSRALAFLAAVAGLLSLLGRFYGLQGNSGAAASANMPAAAALGFVLLGIAIFLRHPEEGAMREISAESPGGVMARRVLPVAIVSPIFIGWLRLQGELNGLYDARFGLVLFALSNVVSFGFIVWNCAALLNRLDRTRSDTERELRERDSKLNMIFENGSIGDWSWDVASDRLTAHASVWRLYGEPNRQGTGPAAWFRARQHPEDVPFIEHSVSEALRSREPLDIEFRSAWPDGTVRWLACRGTASYDSAGNVWQLNGINIDITDRKNAELRFVELADAMPQMVWTASHDGQITYYNRRWYEYTGLRQGEGWQGIIHLEDLPGCIEAWGQCVAEGCPYQFEVRTRRAGDGEFRWHLARAVPVRNAAGTIEQWFGTSTDIHDFKLASAELKTLNEHLELRVVERSHELAASETRYRQLVANVKDYAIFMLDTAGRIASWNAGAERIHGFAEEEVLDLPFSTFFSAQEVEEGKPGRALQVAAAEGQCHEEGWRIRKDGSAYWASVLITAIRGTDGEVTGFSNVTRDMTEQKSAEGLLIAEQKRAEEASRAKSSFLATMSHEIRTPMNAILGMADLLWETDLDPVQTEYVERFRRAGSNLLTLINDILDLSKIESGRFELEQIEIDLDDLLQRTAEMMEPRARLKKVKLTTQAALGTPGAVIGDPGRLQQVLINLIGNAIKFTEAGDVLVTVSAHRDRAAGHLQFSVQDTGMGIPEDKLETIFEDFTQAESSVTRRFGGTGLGLGICRRLVERMNGKLTVTSVPGVGSTFQFDVQLQSCERMAVSTARESFDLRGTRVLVVDDNATNRLIQMDMCAGLGMTTTEAHSAAEACELVAAGLMQGNAFTLVLLDRLMPDVDGLEALRRLRLKDPSICVIITSSDNHPGDVTRATALGAAAYLMKPIRRSHLLDVINAALQKRREAATNSMRILVADDAEDNRFLIAAYLKSKPYELTYASNGCEAVNLFATGTFDLVLMDVQMPVMDGLAATTQIRALEREFNTPPTPVIALTANALVEDTERSQAAGCNAHLSKPISRERLIAAIERFRPVRAVEAEKIEVPEGLEELSSSYLLARRADMQKMRALAADSDLALLQTFGHNMKGIAASLGFPGLTRLGAAIEDAAKRADTNGLTVSISEAAAYIEHACATTGANG